MAGIGVSAVPSLAMVTAPAKLAGVAGGPNDAVPKNCVTTLLPLTDSTTAGSSHSGVCALVVAPFHAGAPRVLIDVARNALVMLASVKRLPDRLSKAFSV